MRFELYRRRTLRGRFWFWRLRAANHKTIATGGEGYHNRIDAEEAIAKVKATGRETETRIYP